MGNRIFILFILVFLCCSTVVPFKELRELMDEITTLSPSEISSKKTEYCSNLKEHKNNFKMKEMITSINHLWDLLYSDVGALSSNSRNKSRIQSQGHLNQILQDCGIQTEKLIMIKSGKVQVGQIDIRTLQENDFNIVVKQRYKKPACGALGQLMHILQSGGFQEMYPDEKIIALALSMHVLYENVIYEWIALLYQRGEIIDAQEEAKCLRSKEFSSLKYKEKPVLEYFKTFANVTTSNSAILLANETTSNSTIPSS